MSHHPVHVEQPSDAEILPRLETPGVLSRVEELIRRYPVKRAALLQVLWLAQETLGWLPNVAIRWSAEKCEVSPVHAYGVSLFYTMYKKVPTGRFFLQICQNVSCHIQGAEAVIAHAEKVLGVDSHGGNTEDGLFTLLRVECLGACGNGPVLQVNDSFATDVVDGELAMPIGVGLDPERFDRIVEWCRRRAAELPEEPVRDALGDILVGTDGHPGATGASAEVQGSYAPPPPALAVTASNVEEGRTKVTWKAAPETTVLHLETRQGGGEFAEVASLSGKDKEWIGELPAGAEIRIVAETAGVRAKPSNIAKGIA
ncbi:MAG: NAD(P)H-dependent oxidoreductase subunit E [Fibrobacteria bacterium]|nr:NAD(P)H-dependent oxidoreductase subunit E [Fibrobacteria bacterium]